MVIIFIVASLVTFLIGFVQYKKEKKRQLVSSRRLAYLFLWQACDNWVDFVLYPFVVGSLGVSYGFVVMFFFTLILNAVYMLANNKTEEDWTFMGSFIHLRDNDSGVWLLPYARFFKSCKLWKIRKPLCLLFSVFRRLLRKKFMGICLSKPIGFLFFSIKFDSFCAIIYLYHKSANLRDIKILSLYLLSHVICNLVWLPIAFGISSVAELIINIKI